MNNARKVPLTPTGRIAQERFEQVTKLLAQGQALGLPSHLLTRRQGRKALAKRGGLYKALRGEQHHGNTVWEKA